MPPWADWLSFALTIAGFSITIWQVRQAKREAAVAREAAEAARNAMLELRAGHDFSELQSKLQATLQLQRDEKWKEALNEYGAAKKLLIAVLESHPKLSLEDRRALNEGLDGLRNVENLIGQGPRKPTRCNAKLSAIIDDLERIRVRLGTRY
ncbi:MAG: hypothetical protein SFV18_06985 [Bryobacteraceae bacterium]|nr:hypothetical protein [Bryobacteraceae bacterium]